MIQQVLNIIADQTEQFLNPNQSQIDAMMILNNLGEKGKCIVTGTKEDLSVSLVDLFPHNLLPCNVACVTKNLQTDKVFSYEVQASIPGRVDRQFTVTFESMTFFKEYNESLLKTLSFEGIDDIFDLFSFLIINHAKGVAKIKRNEVILTQPNYQEYFFRSLARVPRSVISNQSQNRIII